MEGSRADTVAVLIHLVNHAGGRSPTLAVLDGRAAVDSRCGLLGGVVGGADGNGVAFAVGDIAIGGGSFFEIEGLCGRSHKLRNLIIGPLFAFRFECLEQICASNIRIDTKSRTGECVAAHVGFIDLEPAFLVDSRLIRHDNDHGLIVTLVGVWLVDINIPIAIDTFRIVVYSPLDPAHNIFYRAGRDTLVDRESCCTVALLSKHALICRISQIADLACSSQPYGRLRNRSAQSPAGRRPVVVLAAALFFGDLCFICCGCSRVSLIQLHRIEPVPSVLCKDRHAKCILCFADWSRVNVLHMGAVFLAVVTTKSASELPIGLKNQISRDHFPQNRRSIIIKELGFPTVNGNDIIWARSGISSIRGNYQIGYRKKPQYHDEHKEQRHDAFGKTRSLHVKLIPPLRECGSAAAAAEFLLA